MKTKNAELGYAIDSKVYGIPEYATYIKSSLSKLTRDEVNRAIRKQLDTKNLDIVVVAQDCEALKQKLSVLMFEGPAESLVLTENAQPALMAVSMAIVKVLEKQGNVSIRNTARYVAGEAWEQWDVMAFVGEGASVEDTDLRHCVVGKGATVAPGSRLERCVVWAGAHLPRGDYRDTIVTPNRQLPLP